jgi:cell division topological specificity factor
VSSLGSWFSTLFARPPTSAQLAKQRLQSVIGQERLARNSRLPDYLPTLHRELQLVVAKYVHVAPREVSVRFAHPRHAPEGWEVRIELPRPATA